MLKSMKDRKEWSMYNLQHPKETTKVPDDHVLHLKDEIMI